MTSKTPVTCHVYLHILSDLGLTQLLGEPELRHFYDQKAGKSTSFISEIYRNY
jgi:hypothetical protein